MSQELVRRTISAIIMAAGVLYLTWHSFETFVCMCLIASGVLLYEWWGLTKHRSRWWLLIGILYISFSLIALVVIRGMGLEQILGLFAVVWGSDIAAYMVGRKYGKHKIAPHISPGKSWEGLAAAVLVCAGIGAYAALANSSPPDYAMALILGLLTASYAGVGLLGDLFESALKRHAGVKDSGKLIPGHGGLFDRVDALMACASYSLILYLAMFSYAVATNMVVK